MENISGLVLVQLGIAPGGYFILVLSSAESKWQPEQVKDPESQVT